LKTGKISVTSLGKRLLGKKVGDVAEIPRWYAAILNFRKKKNLVV
jgi:transcription elongation GreA/GreB family factor